MLQVLAEAASCILSTLFTVRSIRTTFCIVFNCNCFLFSCSCFFNSLLLSSFTVTFHFNLYRNNLRDLAIAGVHFNATPHFFCLWLLAKGLLAHRVSMRNNSSWSRWSQGAGKFQLLMCVVLAGAAVVLCSTTPSCLSGTDVWEDFQRRRWSACSKQGGTFSPLSNVPLWETIREKSGQLIGLIWKSMTFPSKCWQIVGILFSGAQDLCWKEKINF